MNKKILALAAISALAVPSYALDVFVRIENLAPDNGTYLTPMWYGFHNGGFDAFDFGQGASEGVERIAEDGNPMILMSEFDANGNGLTQGVLNDIGPIAPGARTEKTATINLNGRFFSYASMVIPSNDAFIGNDDAIDLYNGDGDFVGADFIVYGRTVWDAGTEVNDEIPENTAFFGQASPNTGVLQGGVVDLHPGFLPVGSGGILDDDMFAAADFTADGYQVARITVEAVPEPTTLAALGLGALALMRRRQTRK
jgi:hypothetical protein